MSEDTSSDIGNWIFLILGGGVGLYALMKGGLHFWYVAGVVVLWVVYQNVK